MVLIELAASREQPVTEAAAQRLARQIGAYAYVESSALTQRNLKEVFDQALLTALEAKNSPAVLNNGRLLHQNHRSSFRNSVRRKKSTLGCVGGDSDCDSLSSEARGGGWRKLCCIV
ncbi:Small GTPase superfamily [Trinorchestia longiramus]|nr:Small GTPase superfamily [Trinorchestia longiramus]